MKTDIETLLSGWRERTAEAELSQLEPRVWACIDARQRTPMAEVLGFRAALVAAIMVTGIVAGGAASATAQPDPSPFALHSAYAPSTLLEGRE